MPVTSSRIIRPLRDTPGPSTGGRCIRERGDTRIAIPICWSREITPPAQVGRFPPPRMVVCWHHLRRCVARTLLVAPARGEPVTSSGHATGICHRSVWCIPCAGRPSKRDNEGSRAGWESSSGCRRPGSGKPWTAHRMGRYPVCVAPIPTIAYDWLRMRMGGSGRTSATSRAGAGGWGQRSSMTATTSRRNT